jgi:hypothetical protein
VMDKHDSTTSIATDDNSGDSERINDYVIFRESIAKEYRQIKRFISEHPSLSIFILYVSLSFIALSQVMFLNSFFNVKPLIFLELIDLFQVLLNNPIALLALLFFFAVMGLVTALYKLDIIDKYMERTTLRHKYSKNRLVKLYYYVFNYPFYKISLKVTLIVTFFGLGLFYSYIHTERLSEKIKQGKENLITLTISQGLEVETVRPQYKGNIILNTNKYLWLYMPSTKKVMMFNHNNVLSLDDIEDEHWND